MSRAKQRKMAANFYRGWQYRRWKSARMIRYAERHGVRVEPWQARYLETTLNMTRKQMEALALTARRWAA